MLTGIFFFFKHNNGKEGACCYLHERKSQLAIYSKHSKRALTFRRTVRLNGRAQHERGRTRARDERQLHAAREASRTTREPVLFQNG